MEFFEGEDDRAGGPAAEADLPLPHSGSLSETGFRYAAQAGIGRTSGRLGW